MKKLKYLVTIFTFIFSFTIFAQDTESTYSTYGEQDAASTSCEDVDGKKRTISGDGTTLPETTVEVPVDSF